MDAHIAKIIALYQVAHVGRKIAHFGLNQQKNADILVETLKSLNLEHEIRILEVTLDTGIWYRVTIGAFAYENDANALMKLLEESEGIKGMVTSY